eukprot:3633918-Pleurochrysis_carterae.AAC.1
MRGHRGRLGVPVCVRHPRYVPSATGWQFVARSHLLAAVRVCVFQVHPAGPSRCFCLVPAAVHRQWRRHFDTGEIQRKLNKAATR